MSSEKRRLGRSLESLISAARGHDLNMDMIRRSGHRVQAVPVERITPNPFQPRRDFDIDALNDLISSLRVHGLMQPVVVRKTEGDGFELVAGERRWRAVGELGWETIDAVIIEADDRRMLEWALVENIQRQSLGPLELARAFKQLSEEFRLTQDEVAKAVGMSRPAVANIVRLLELPEPIQARVSRGTVSMGAARALLGLPRADQQELLAARVESGELNVRQVEELVRKAANAPGEVAARPRPAADPNLLDLAREIQGFLGMRTEIRGTLRRGRLVLHYHSGGELDRVVRILRRWSQTQDLGVEEELSDDITV